MMIEVMFCMIDRRLLKEDIMNQAENRTPGNVPEQRTYKVEDIAVMFEISAVLLHITL